tara:strand:+ start:423 stop:884 length:462 start_codon:yes stop_codon:yes gene_type:complete
MKKYFKKCEEFTICGALGFKSEIIGETSIENQTMFQVMVRGSGRVGKAFDPNYIELVEGQIHDVSNLVGSNRVYQPHEDFKVYGFNALNSDDKWSFKKITDSFKGDDKSWLICFDGSPEINGVTMKSLDYAKLSDKDYNVKINDGLVGVFTKL